MRVYVRLEDEETIEHDATNLTFHMDGKILLVETDISTTGYNLDRVVYYEAMRDDGQPAHNNQGEQ